LTIEGDRFIGRGATEDKGPAIAALLGALAARESGAPITIQFRWGLEGEIGSERFANAIEPNRERLAPTASSSRTRSGARAVSQVVRSGCVACSRCA
jgi:acetylornithine deacetylase/succinyl-diaminopimelate desuccinylase-like protein